MINDVRSYAVYLRVREDERVKKRGVQKERAATSTYHANISTYFTY